MLFISECYQPLAERAEERTERLVALTRHMRSGRRSEDAVEESAAGDDAGAPVQPLGSNVIELRFPLFRRVGELSFAIILSASGKAAEGLARARRAIAE